MIFMSKAKVGSVAIAATLLLSACASTPEECDPSQDQGFFGKMGCIVTGSYEVRVNAKQQKANDLSAEIASINQMTRDIHAQNRALMGDYFARMKVLDKTKEDLYMLESSLAKKKALNSDLQDQLNSVKDKVDAMSTQSAASQSIAKKQKEIDELNEELDLLAKAMEI